MPGRFSTRRCASAARLRFFITAAPPPSRLSGLWPFSQSASRPLRRHRSDIDELVDSRPKMRANQQCVMFLVAIVAYLNFGWMSFGLYDLRKHVHDSTSFRITPERIVHGQDGGPRASLGDGQRTPS